MRLPWDAHALLRPAARRRAVAPRSALFSPQASALPVLHGGSGGSASSSRSVVKVLEKTLLRITEERLRQFLQAEVSFFAEQNANSITLREILDASTPEAARRLSLKELPVRYAQRIHQIEELDGWEKCEGLREVHEFYWTSFRDLRLLDPHSDSLVPFTMTVKELKNRMKGVIPRLANSIHRLDIDEAKINQWLDSFLLSRIGTEMLTSQYIACIEPVRGGRSTGVRGIVDSHCDPADICAQAAKHAIRLCRQHYTTQHEVRIIVESHRADGEEGPIRFPYVPQYLFYIMVELLKNSARATVESCGDNKKKLQEHPIVITVGADESQVGIRVDDLAGGIPFNVVDRVWSYMYTTAKSGGAAAAFAQEGTPLAGYGVGLPLSRLYARYLGGSLQLMSLPGIGTSAYLYLKRLDSEAREQLPVKGSPERQGALGKSSF